MCIRDSLLKQPSIALRTLRQLMARAKLLARVLCASRCILSALRRVSRALDSASLGSLRQARNCLHMCCVVVVASKGPPETTNTQCRVNAL
eukprot:11491077-Alexandrium_andersonii.AAC.1